MYIPDTFFGIHIYFTHKCTQLIGILMVRFFTM